MKVDHARKRRQRCTSERLGKDCGLWLTPYLPDCCEGPLWLCPICDRPTTKWVDDG